MRVLKLIQDGDSNTALIEACQLGDVERATVQLDHGANVNYQNKVREHLSSTTVLFILTGLALQDGESALWCASSAGETECVKVLVKYGAQVDLPVRCDHR